jgi:hypothetical protein
VPGPPAWGGRRAATWALFRTQAVRAKREAKDASRDSATWTEHCVLGLMTQALEGMPAGPPAVGLVVDLANLALGSQVREPEGRLIATLPIVPSRRTVSQRSPWPARRCGSSARCGPTSLACRWSGGHIGNLRHPDGTGGDTVRVFITQLDVPPPMPAAVAADISAQPGGQSAATLLAARNNIITTVALNNGVLLRPILGGAQSVFNRSTNPSLVFPPLSTAIEGYGLNVATAIPVGNEVTFLFDGIGTW